MVFHMEMALAAEVRGLRQTLEEARYEALVARAEAAHALADAARTKAINADLEARNALLELQNAKMRNHIYGQKAERSVRLIDQMELTFEELEASAAEDEAIAAQAAVRTNVVAFERKRPSRKPLPDHLPRERVVIAAPTECPCCGSDKLSKLGEDITETLEVIPRQWKVVQTVREKFSCRACEKITQPPAPFHVTPRGLFGPSFLAMLLFEKFGQHQPLNRQSERYAREGVEISLSTLADQVGACVAALTPLHRLIEAHVLASERLHGDDTTVPVLAKLKTDTGRIWTYVRDDRPFCGDDPPAALFYYSRDRRQEHPEQHLEHYSGILQADAYGGYNPLFKPGRASGMITHALCWAHARRKFFELADASAQLKRRKRRRQDCRGQSAEPSPIVSPMAVEAIRQIDALFDSEREINGQSAVERRAVRQERAAPIVTALHTWMHDNRARLSKHDPVAKAMNYMLADWPAFTAFLDDGRICLTNNAAERALRGIALGRKSWLFAGSDRGGQRAAFMYTLIGTAKLNDIDPQAWLADVLARIADIPQTRLSELLPWNWQTPLQLPKAA
jgi:transposase